MNYLNSNLAIRFSAQCGDSFVHIGTILAVTILLSCPSSYAHSQEPILDEVAFNKWNEYDRFSRSLQGTVRMKTIYETNKVTDQTLHYRQNRECALRQQLWEGKAFEVILLMNRQYSAELERNVSDRDKTILVQYAANPQSVLPMSAGQPVDHLVSMEIAPHFTYWNLGLTEVFKQQSFQIKNVSRISENGNELVRVEHTNTRSSPGKQFKRAGTIYFDPQQFWCVRRIEETEQIYHDDVLYRTAHWDIRHETVVGRAGFPIIKELTMKWDGSLPNDRKTSGTVQAMYELSVDDGLPEREFTLSSFGLPEPVGVDWKKPTPRYLWILLAAAVAAALAFTFRFLARRGRVAI